MKFRPLSLSLSLAATLMAGSAFAQSGYTIKLGYGSIDPRATSSDLKGTLPAYNAAAGGYLGNVAVSSGVSLEVQTQDTLMFSIERALNDNWAVELRLGYPPKHDVKLRVNNPQLQGDRAMLSDAGKAAVASAEAAYGPAGGDAAVAKVGQGVGAKLAANNGLVVAGVRQWAPTLFLNYKFGDKTQALRPWVGVGINHTTFKSSTNAVGNELYHDGAVRVKLSDSTGLAFQTGVTYQFDQNWSLQASWMTAAVKHNLTTYTDHSSQKATYRFHPSVFAAVVAYSF
ncbi:OmpW/AlkL family protein [Aquabacterium sp.]|uniref:OmpW/AlkL family protein n=1 Tax=Aquabacterium sp. TaxID=1872578 RepID=UPI003BB07BD4